MQVSTSSYQFSHGKRPSGTGTWAFWFVGVSSGPGAMSGEPFWFTGSYSEAKRAAVSAAEMRFATRIEVGA